MSENWGPYYSMPALLRKTDSGKTILRESFDYDLLRQELIANGLPLEVVKVRNPWFYRKQNSDTWMLIGESEDIEDNFQVEWDISKLENGSYELMALMQVLVEEGMSERATVARQSVAGFTIQN